MRQGSDFDNDSEEAPPPKKRAPAKKATTKAAATKATTSKAKKAPAKAPARGRAKKAVTPPVRISNFIRLSLGIQFRFIRVMTTRSSTWMMMTSLKKWHLNLLKEPTEQPSSGRSLANGFSLHWPESGCTHSQQPAKKAPAKKKATAASTTAKQTQLNFTPAGRTSRAAASKARSKMVVCV